MLASESHGGVAGGQQRRRRGQGAGTEDQSAGLGGGLWGRRGAFPLPSDHRVEVAGRQPGTWRREVCAGRFPHVKRVITAALRGGGRLTSQTALPSESAFSLC